MDREKKIPTECGITVFKGVSVVSEWWGSSLGQEVRFSDGRKSFTWDFYLVFLYRIPLGATEKR